MAKLNLQCNIFRFYFGSLNYSTMVIEEMKNLGYCVAIKIYFDFAIS